MIIAIAHRDPGEEWGFSITALDEPVDIWEFDDILVALGESEELENIGYGFYKIIIGRAYIDTGVVHPSSPGQPYWHIKYIEGLVPDGNGNQSEVLPSF